jgi:hypothetical protein
MHWLDGIALVKTWRIGCPEALFDIVGSLLNECPSLPNRAYGPE